MPRESPRLKKSATNSKATNPASANTSEASKPKKTEAEKDKKASVEKPKESAQTSQQDKPKSSSSKKTPVTKSTLLNECKTLFGISDLYKVLGLEKLEATANDSKTEFKASFS
jgi:hypothetical protein